ncbi:MAG: hypothetical protein WA705_25425 [Candidatus Ozemobacteraceae bacterium]
MKLIGDIRQSRGFAYPLVILAVIMIAGFVTTSSILTQGLKNQLIQSDTDNFSFTLAYSALSKIMGKIHADSWNNRPFNGKAFSEYDVSLNGGTYDLFVEDSPGKTYQADVYVKTTLDKKTNLYFWRIRFHDDLLDVSNRIQVDFFMKGDPADFPKGIGSSFSAKVDDLMKQRKNNQKDSDITAASIETVNDPKQIVSVLGGRPMNKFTQNYPSSPDDVDAMVKQKGQNPLAFPTIEPPSQQEVPNAPGPGPSTIGPNPNPGNSANPGSGTGFPTYDSGLYDVTSNQVSKLTDSIKKSSENSAKFAQESVDLGNANKGDEANTKMSVAAKNADAALTGMSQLVTDAKGYINTAPNLEAAQATKDLIVNTTVSGMQNVTAGVSNYANNQFATYAQGVGADPNMSSGDMQKTLDGLKNGGLKSVERMVDQVKSIADSLGPLATDPKIQAAITQTVADAQKALDAANEAIKKLEEAVKAKKEAEKAAAEAAAAAAAGS